MKSIERRFDDTKLRNCNNSSYINLAHAVKGQKFSRDTVSRWFKKLVEKDDYDASDRNHLIKQLTELSNPPEDNDLSAKLPR